MRMSIRKDAEWVLAGTGLTESQSWKLRHRITAAPAINDCPRHGPTRTRTKNRAPDACTVSVNGLPNPAMLAAVLPAADVHDSRMLEEAIDAIPPIAGHRGRPRHRPKKWHAGKGYDYARCRTALRARGIIARISRRETDSSARPWSLPPGG